MKLTIKRKMTITLVVSCTGMAIIMVLLLSGFASMRKHLREMERFTAINNGAMHGNIAMLKAREFESEFFTRHQDKWIERVVTSVAEVNKSLDSINANNDDKKIREQSDQARKLGQQYITQFSELAKTAAQSNFDESAYADGREELRDIINEFEPLLDNYIPKAVQTKFKAAQVALDKEVSATKTEILLAILLVTIFLASLLSTITIQVNYSLKMMVDRLKDIAQGDGDLTKRIVVKSDDECGELAGWFNTFIEKLHGIISQVASTSLQVAAAAEEMSRTSEQMADGVQAVAEQAVVVASSSEEMAATSFEIASNCTMVADSARQANGSAMLGVTVVTENSQNMERIATTVNDASKSVEGLGKSSEQISDIVRTIEDIADMTNLLALNASIEAARAGEQGRGFAVVADEVRALADRTSRATKEIAQMIKSIQQATGGVVATMAEGVKRVVQGTEDAKKSGQSLQDILGQVESVTGQINQIASAAEAQTETTGRISRNIVQINEGMQSTAKGAQDSAEAACQLAGLAEELSRLVGQFKLAV